MDILLVMDGDFEVERVAAPAQVIFDSVRAKLLFEADVFWALSKTRYCGTGVAVIQSDDEMLLAQQCISNLTGDWLFQVPGQILDFSRLTPPVTS